MTETDEAVASEATRILASQGSNLVVTGSQVVRWRLADIFDVDENGRMGRGNTRTYPPNAPDVAAHFARALAEDRNLNQATLASFASGVEVARPGLQTAYARFFGWMERQLQKSRERQVNVRIPGAATEASGASARRLTDAVQKVMGGEELSPELMSEVVRHIAGPEGLEHLLARDGDASELVSSMKNLSISALRQTVKTSSQSDLTWAIASITALFEYVQTLSEFFDLTSAEGAQPLALVLANLGRTARKSKVSRGVANAIIAPALLLMVAHEPSKRRNFEETVAACRRELPRLRAVVALAEDMPPEVRPFLGPAGAAAFDAESEEVRVRLKALVQPWIEAHPDEAAILTPQRAELPEAS